MAELFTLGDLSVMGYSRQQKLGLAMIGVSLTIFIFCQFTNLALIHKPTVEFGKLPEVSVTVDGPEFVLHWPALPVFVFLVTGIVPLFRHDAA